MTPQDLKRWREMFHQSESWLDEPLELVSELPEDASKHMEPTIYIKDSKGRYVASDLGWTNNGHIGVNHLETLLQARNTFIPLIDEVERLREENERLREKVRILDFEMQVIQEDCQEMAEANCDNERAFKWVIRRVRTARQKARELDV